MFAAFLPFFRRSHEDASPEQPLNNVAQLRESMLEVTRATAARPSEVYGLKAQLLSDTSTWEAKNPHTDRAAKYATFAARLPKLGETSVTGDEFTFTMPAESPATSAAPRANSFSEFFAHLPEETRRALADLSAPKPSAPFATAPTTEPASPTQPRVDPRGPSAWDMPPLR